MFSQIFYTIHADFSSVFSNKHEALKNYEIFWAFCEVFTAVFGNISHVFDANAEFRRDIYSRLNRHNIADSENLRAFRRKSRLLMDFNTHSVTRAVAEIFPEACIFNNISCRRIGKAAFNARLENAESFFLSGQNGFINLSLL